MKPVTTFDNFPSFGNAGPRQAPGDAKYALGFVAADTLPAEWANYFFHGATKGVSDLNSAVRSLWLEMNSVLEAENVTPDANVNNQLLEALNKIKAEAILAAHPVGSLYWTSSSENPAITFGGGTWVQIKDKFILAAGDSYTNGGTGGAATVVLTEQQLPSHTHTFTGSAVTSGGASTETVTITDPGHRHKALMSGGSGSLTGATISLIQSKINQINTYIQSETTGITAKHAHTHSVTASGTNSATGGGEAHDNMPPYIVKYCWERTA